MTPERGVLLHRHGRRGTVITPDGEFQTVWLTGGRREIGEEVPLRQFRPSHAWQAVAAAMVLLLGGFWFWNGRLQAAPVAWVTIDINPSLKLGIDGHGLVREATALDADGRRLLSQLRYLGRPLTTVVDEATRLAEEDGFLPANRPAAVVIAVSPLRKLPPAAEEAIKLSKSQVVSLTADRPAPVAVQEIMIPPGELKQAASEDLTPARFALRQQLLAKGIRAPVGKIRRLSLFQLLEEVRRDEGVASESLSLPATAPESESTAGSNGRAAVGGAGAGAPPPVGAGRVSVEHSTGRAHEIEHPAGLPEIMRRVYEDYGKPGGLSLEGMKRGESFREKVGTSVYGRNGEGDAAGPGDGLPLLIQGGVKAGPEAGGSG